mmetsp:Transcript_72943/g.206707  ORF Transcript_72943/g.206707 Transcript_72943/m.206707 type:complete len:218 (-) Transcript_72943:381-1034(-)
MHWMETRNPAASTPNSAPAYRSSTHSHATPLARWAFSSRSPGADSALVTRSAQWATPSRPLVLQNRFQDALRARSHCSHMLRFRPRLQCEIALLAVASPAGSSPARSSELPSGARKRWSSSESAWSTFTPIQRRARSNSWTSILPLLSRSKRSKAPIKTILSCCRSSWAVCSTLLSTSASVRVPATNRERDTPPAATTSSSAPVGEGARSRKAWRRS